MLLLAISMLAGMDVGNASRYGYEGDVYDNVGTFACRRTLSARYGSKMWQKMRSHGVAHRTLPCGTRIGICNQRTGRCTAAYVVDRGPWGALDRHGEWHVRTGKLAPGEHYRGVLDLLPGVYSAIDLQGIEKVVFWPMPDPAQAQHSRDTRLPPLRSLGPSPFAFYLAPSHRSSPFPPLRTWETGEMLASVTAPKKFREGALPPLRGLDSLEPQAVPTLVATAQVAVPAAPVRPVVPRFPPLRDASFPMPDGMVQSRYGMGRSSKAETLSTTRPLPANS
ncbi:MAG: hypothetical protein JNM40_26135 [Myxococcales bacterium]|nr:hypothetical protein [Myxococcales bacterium]